MHRVAAPQAAGQGRFRIRVASLAAGSILWGTFILKLPLLLLLGLGLAIMGFAYATSRHGRISKLGLLVLANYAYWAVSGLLVGAVALSDFASPAFYNGDGRVFIYYFPLLLFAALPISPAVFRNNIKQSVLIVAVLGPLFAFWLVTRVDFLAGGYARNFFGLMTSHTGAGTFFATLGLALTLFGARTRNRRYIALGLIAFLAVFGTASRQSLVGIIAVGGWYFLKKARFRTIVYGGVVAVLMAGAMIRLTPHTYERTRALFSEEMLSSMARTFENASWEPDRDVAVGSEQYNIQARMLYWAYAIRRFADSPVLGIGFGRYNDANVRLVGIPGLFSPATRGTKVISDMTAHNSYLHVLSESGLVGLGMLGWLWLAMYRRLAQGVASGGQLSSYYTACQGLVIFALVGALFGHGLASPSVGLPVLTFVGVGLGVQRTRREETDASQQQISPYPSSTQRVAPVTTPARPIKNR